MSCSSGAVGGLDAGPFDAVAFDASLRDVSETFDAGLTFQSFDVFVPDARTCVAPTATDDPAGTTCLARGSAGPCSSLCDAGSFYSCLAGQTPGDAGSCAVVDAGDLFVAATQSLCCGYSTCARYSVSDSACPNEAWSCPFGAPGPPGGTSTMTGPTSDTTIWCL